MRHRRARTKLKSTSSHRGAMFSNMVMALLQHGRIKTTERKARELRGIAERIVTKAASLGDLLLKDPAKFSVEEKAKMVHVKRVIASNFVMSGSVTTRQDIIHRLFNEVAPRYIGRPGGYTRMTKIGPRKGDAAPMAILEFVDAPLPAREGAAPTDEEKAPKKARKSLMSRVSKKEKEEVTTAPAKTKAKPKAKAETATKAKSQTQPKPRATKKTPAK